MKWRYRNDTDHIIIFRGEIFKPESELETTFSGLTSLGFTCIQEGTSPIPDNPQSVDELTNLDVLKKISVNSNDQLVYDGRVVGEKAIEVDYSVTLVKNQDFIELPEDCDTSRAIILNIQGITTQKDTDWRLVEKNYPEKDLITWGGLGLEDIVQAGDTIVITYYKKV